MPLTSIGLGYANVTSLEKLKAATKLNLDFNGSCVLSEIEALFSALAECTKLTSLQVNFIQEPGESMELSQASLQTFMYLKSGLIQWGGRLKEFQLFLETNYRDDDEYENALLNNFQQLAQASTRLTSLTDCLIHIRAKDEAISYQLFNHVINFLSMPSLPMLNSLELNLNNCRIIGHDCESQEINQIYSNFMSVLDRCKNLQQLVIQINLLPTGLQNLIAEFIAANRTVKQIELNFPQAKLDLRPVVDILQNPILQYVNMDLSYADIDLNNVDIVLYDLFRGRPSQVDAQIILFAQAVKNHTSLVSLSLSGFFERWLSRNIQGRVSLIKQMFDLISKSKTLQALTLNFNIMQYFSTTDTAQITRFFMCNRHLHYVEIQGLKESHIRRLSEHLKANKNDLNEIFHLEQQRLMLLNPAAILRDIYNPYHKKIQEWSFSECASQDNLLFYYLISLPQRDLVESQFYIQYMSSIFQKIYNKSYELPYSDIASYLDKQDIAKVLQITGGFFTQLKTKLPEGGVKRQRDENNSEEGYIVKRR